MPFGVTLIEMSSEFPIVFTSDRELLEHLRAAGHRGAYNIFLIFIKIFYISFVL
jgi:hypothetical protein